MNDKLAWQKSEYFSMFDEFDPDVAYIPSILIKNIAQHEILASESIEGDLGQIALSLLGTILKMAFSPVNKKTPPLGYVESLDIASLAKKVGQTDAIVNRILQMFQHFNILYFEEDYVLITHPDEWQIPSEIADPESIYKLGSSQLRHMVGLIT